MSGLISVVYSFIWIFAVVAIITTSVKKAAARNRIDAIKRSSYAPDEKMYVNKTNKPAAPAKKVTKVSGHGTGMILKDDTANDWLAGQLREESRAMTMISDMFQLKAQHSNSCDAEFIKRFHESNCDADGIDDGMRKPRKR